MRSGKTPSEIRLMELRSGSMMLVARGKGLPSDLYSSSFSFMRASKCVHERPESVCGVGYKETYSIISNVVIIF